MMFFDDIQEKTSLIIDQKRLLYIESVLKSMCLEFDLPIPRIRADFKNYVDKGEICISVFSDSELTPHKQACYLMGHYLCNLYSLGRFMSDKVAKIIGCLHEIASNQSVSNF